MKRICPIHGLWNKQQDEDRCPDCSKSRAKVYDKTKRDKESNKFYHSREWKNLRTLILNENPFCVACGKAAQMVDHIKAIKDGGEPLDQENLQSMCNSCHNKKENQEGNRW